MFEALAVSKSERDVRLSFTVNVLIYCSFVFPSHTLLTAVSSFFSIGYPNVKSSAEMLRLHLFKSRLELIMRQLYRGTSTG